MPLRAAVRAARRAEHALLRPLRRRRAQRAVARLGRVKRVLVLCWGNICRSPYGEARLKALTRFPGSSDGDSGIEIRSAGFIGPGRPSPPEARAAARQCGLSLEPHVSRLVDGDLAGWADLHVVMDRRQARILKGRFGVAPARILVLGDLDPEPVGRREIPDPVDQPEEIFLETYRRMDRCLAALASLLAEGP